MVVDSSIWIEILSGGKLASKCENLIKNKTILVPTIVIFEVYKKIKKSSSEDVALEVVSHLSKYKIIEISRDISFAAADLAIEKNLGMANALVLATAQINKTTLFTLDNDFTSIQGVEVVR